MRVNKWGEENGGREVTVSRDYCWIRVGRNGKQCDKPARAYIVERHRQAQILRIVGLFPNHLRVCSTIGVGGRLYRDPELQPNGNGAKPHRPNFEEVGP